MPQLADLYSSMQGAQSTPMGSGAPMPQTQQGTVPEELEPKQIENLETLLGVEIPKELWPTIMKIVKNKNFKLPTQQGQQQGYDDTMEGSDQDQDMMPSDGSGDSSGAPSYMAFGQANQ
jgi:hypothetical protein